MGLMEVALFLVSRSQGLLYQQATSVSLAGVALLLAAHGERDGRWSRIMAFPSGAAPIVLTHPSQNPLHLQRGRQLPHLRS